MNWYSAEQLLALLFVLFFPPYPHHFFPLVISLSLFFDLHFLFYSHWPFSATRRTRMEGGIQKKDCRSFLESRSRFLFLDQYSILNANGKIKGSVIFQHSLVKGMCYTGKNSALNFTELFKICGHLYFQNACVPKNCSVKSTKLLRRKCGTFRNFYCNFDILSWKVL